MSDGKEQYADSAFNKAAEAAMEAYKKKHYETWHMGEVDVGAPLQQLAIDMAQKGADMTAAALWAPPRNQYEPLFPRGAALSNLPSTSSTLTGRQPSAPVFQQYPDVITQGDTRYARPSPLAQSVQSMFPDATPERDPDGLDPHTPGAKMDAGKTPLATQVGGNHYKGMKIQPVEYIHANGIGYFEGSVIKYVSRWRQKGGVADLEKAKHFIDLLLELEKRI